MSASPQRDPIPMPKTCNFPPAHCLRSSKSWRYAFTWNELILRLRPDVKTGTKWSAREANQEAESTLQAKEIIGFAPTNRVDLDIKRNQLFCKQCPNGKRFMVIEGLRNVVEEQWTTTAVSQSKNVLGQHEIIFVR